jgi:hypothetical protein
MYLNTDDFVLSISYIQQSKILAIKPTLSAQAQSVNHRQLITSSNVISNSVDNMLDVSSSPDVHYPLHSISPSEYLTP